MSANTIIRQEDCSLSSSASAAVFAPSAATSPANNQSSLILHSRRVFRPPRVSLAALDVMSLFTGSARLLETGKQTISCQVTGKLIQRGGTQRLNLTHAEHRVWFIFSPSSENTFFLWNVKAAACFVSV